MKCKHESCENEAVVTGIRLYIGAPPKAENFVAEFDIPRCEKHRQDVFDLQATIVDKGEAE